MSKKKTTVKDMLDQLNEKIDEFMDSDELFRTWLKSSAKFHKYSPNNMLLIWIQDPEATAVNSFKRWLELGRVVKKGETAIRIIAPRTRKAKTEDEKDGIWFAAVPVFSYEQTEAVEGFENPWEPYKLPQLGDADVADQHEELIQSLNKSGITISSEEGGHPTANGYYSAELKQIWIKPGRATLDTFRTLIHESAHHEHLSKWKDDKDLGSSFLEYVAEASAYAVLQGFGLDSEAASIPYLSAWKSRGLTDEQITLGVSRVGYVVAQITGRFIPEEEVAEEKAA